MTAVAHHCAVLVRWKLIYLLVPSLAALFATSHANYDELGQELRAADGRIRGVRDRENKDFVFGGLFPVHSDDPSSGGGRCGGVRLERGLERMEAMLYSLDRINADPTLLPGLQIGYDIRDTCNSENIGLDESIDLIISGSQLDIESCQSGITTDTNGTGDVVLNAPTSGIVGAASSRVSVPIASLVRLFRTPQVSYASSSAILSNRDRYEYFYRTIPPDNLQAKAMIDVILRFNWTLVSTIYSRNPYGEPGIVEFQNLAVQNGICVDVNEGIDDDFVDENFQAIVDLLIASRANVVILFASQDNAEKLLGKVALSSAARRFTWIASDAWARSINVVHQFNETAAGLFGFTPLTDHVEDFHDYFSNLTIQSNVRNPWFPEFYAAFVNCTLNETCVENVNVTRLPRYQQGNFIPLVLDAVYTYAHALNNFLNENCDSPITWYRHNRTCGGQRRALNGSALLEYISELQFQNVLTGNTILFDDEGNVEARYEILNYQANDMDGTREYSFQRIGTWDSSIANDTNLEALNLMAEIAWQFGINETGGVVSAVPESQCVRCTTGQYRILVLDSCCGICDSCVGQNYSDNPFATHCSVCPGETWGNNPLERSDSCVQLSESYLEFNDPWSIMIMIIASFGLISVAVTCVIFGIYWRSPVVKSSGREQMVLLLVGISLSFIIAFIFISPPVKPICTIQRLGLWFCFSLMIGALMVKIIRVARIFLRGATVSRPRFTEPIYQILFTFLIVLGQLVIVTVSLIYQNPVVNRTRRNNPDDDRDFPLIVVTCVADPLVFLILSIGYQTILIGVSTVLGVLSFKYPENFNEAKYVSFCTFALLVIWVAFIPTYFATQATQEFQNAAISLAVIMSAFAILVCLFGPKLFIILLRPKNNVPHYTTHHAGDFQLQTDTVLGPSMPSLSNYSRSILNDSGSRERKSECECVCLTVITHHN